MAIGTRVVLFGCLIFLLVPFVLSAIRFNTFQNAGKNNQTFTWGSVGPLDRHIAGAVLRFPGNGTGYLRREYRTPHFAWGTRISAIQFIDNWQNGRNANITEITSQANMAQARVVLVSQWGNGMDFTIRVWGH